MNDFEKETERMDKLLLNREFTPDERQERAVEIDGYLISRGGIIIAASCKDGILLIGVNPSNERTIFQVFHRIGLLGLGKARDCDEIHRLALTSAYGTGINLSKADIDVRDIVTEIASEIDRNFSYTRSRRGSYKADFIIVELGFTPEEDFLDVIKASGEVRPEDNSGAGCLGIIERAVIHPVKVRKKIVITDKDGNAEKDEKGNTKTKEVFDLVPEFIFPVTSGLALLFEEIIRSGNDIKGIKEAALFIGLVIRLFNERGGELEMVYLDREMLKKSKSEKRRFHHIWQRITDPNPYVLSDPWQDWRNFVAPAYKKAEHGEITPKIKLLIKFYEAFEKNLDAAEENLFKKLTLSELCSANFKFVKGLFRKEKKE